MQDVSRLLQRVRAGIEAAERQELAAQLSKAAAKAEDPILLLLGGECATFVEWLAADEPLVQAYAACILANVAFIEEGQQRVLDARAILPLMGLLRGATDKKVKLHAAAAVQNLTFQNVACCTDVLQLRGAAILKKLSTHNSEGVQQFASGALANLRLYRYDGSDRDGAPPADKKVEVAKEAPFGGRDGAVAATAEQVVAAVTIQAVWRGREIRRRCIEKMRLRDKKKPRYEAFSVHTVRSELQSKPCAKPMPVVRLGALGAPSALGSRRGEPGRLAPIARLPPPSRNVPLPPLGKAGPLAMVR